MMLKYFYLLCLIGLTCGCKKKDNNPTLPTQPTEAFILSSLKINETETNNLLVYNINPNPTIKISFSSPVDKVTVTGNILFNQTPGPAVAYNVSYADNDNTIIIQPTTPLLPITKYTFTISTGLQSQQKAKLKSGKILSVITAIDSTDKFPRIPDEQLLDLVQRQTFKYFWDFGHPISGMSRERNSSGDIVTTGGTGFGIMSIIVAIHRNFITRSEGLARINKIVNFLKNNCTPYHGAFAHWVNGATGATVPFSAKDNGADLVETSYLMQGLLCARQYFNTASTDEVALRTDINTLWNAVEWNWFRQNDQNVLYWHWSPNYNWEMNHQVKGWNEALIVYSSSASSNTDSISNIVYHNGWASNGGMRNGNSYYGIQLPLGPTLGGPLFFAHYSFLGINPNGLTDLYANYLTQNTAHTQINYNYCIANPKGFNGYSNLVWGLTASDEQNGYSAHAPDNDNGDEVERSLPLLKKHYLRYAEYAGVVMKDVFYGWIDTIKPLMCERLGSAVCYGDGKGNFTIKDLPKELQLAPIFSFQKIHTFTPNESTYLSGGNFFDVIPYEGRYDAQPLALFSSRNNSINFIPQSNLTSLKQQVRDIKWLKTATGGNVLMVATNNDQVLFYKFKN